jgi:hypothetical protein
MAREDFIRDVWKADRELHPSNGRSASSNGNALTKLLRRSDIWLTPTVVQNYQPGDFADIPPDHQQALKEAVENYRRVAAAAPATAVAVAEQAQEAKQHLETIVSTLQVIIKPEWEAALQHLFQEVETWSRGQDWAVNRDVKEEGEPILGSYHAPRMLIHTPEGRLLLNPITRFAAGANGVVEFCVMPSFDSVTLIRPGTEWFLLPDDPDEPPQRLTEETFLSVARDLLGRQ